MTEGPREAPPAAADPVPAPRLAPSAAAPSSSTEPVANRVEGAVRDDDPGGRARGAGGEGDGLGLAARQRAMRWIIAAQCGGMLGPYIFRNGLMLTFLTALDADGPMVLLALSLYNILKLINLPVAYLADRVGLKRIGMVGLLLSTAGVPLLAAAAWFSEPIPPTILGILLCGAGGAVFASSWFALLLPVVPESMRGRFFGAMRLGWTFVVLLFTALTAWFLGEAPELWRYQALLGIVFAGQILRIVAYRRIPEVRTEPDGPRAPFFRALLRIARAPGYLPFGAYLFLLTLCTMAVPALFGMIEKKALGLGDNMVVTLGLCHMAGSLVGFLLGGQVVDRLGNKVVFLLCHVGYGAVLLAFVLRAALPGPGWLVLGTIHGVYGVIASSSGLAITSEIMALAPKQGRALATGGLGMLLFVAGALSEMTAAGLLSLGALAPAWSWRGLALTDYDTVLLLYAGMVLLMTGTLGLVPSVIRKAAHIPQA